MNNYKDWLNINNDKILLYKEIINNEGAINDIDSIKSLETKYNTKFDKCFIEFLLEDINRPIIVYDFNSLYPSIMRTFNMSHEKMIMDTKLAKYIVENKLFKLNKIEFTYLSNKHVSYFVAHDNNFDKEHFGVIPSILDDLAKLRNKYKDDLKIIKNSMKQLDEDRKEDDLKNNNEYNELEVQYNMLDVKQNAIKIFMNSFYGETGFTNSPLYSLEIACGVTTYGGIFIKHVDKYVRDELKCKVFYGDSVTEDTPVLIRYTKGIFTGYVNIVTIDNILGSDWVDYPEFKSEDNSLLNKEQSSPQYGIEVFTCNGWKILKRVIRHKTNKKLYRINTHIGCVDVTEDHSLITYKGELLDSKNAKIGHELFHTFPNEYIENKRNIITEEEAYVYGFNIYFNSCWYKIIYILNSSINIRKLFIKGICAYNGYSLKDNEIILTFDYEHKLIAQYTYYLIKSISYQNVIINCDKNNIYIQINKDDRINELYSIKKIIELPSIENQYVYDIETEDGTFLAGIGSICVKNTDSLFISLPSYHYVDIDKKYYSGNVDKLTYYNQMVDRTIMLSKDVESSINNMLINVTGSKFLKMCYEGVLYNCIFLSKKKYIGIKHVEKPNFTITDKNLYLKGVEMKRKGVPKFFINTYDNLIKQFLSPNNYKTIIELVLENIDNITKDLKYKIDNIYYMDEKIMNEFVDSFIMTDEYRPNKNNKKVKTFVEEMKKRDILIGARERFEYIVVEKYPFKFNVTGSCSKEIQIGEKMEKPEIVKANQLKIDVDYYMVNIILGKFARLLAYIPEFDDVTILDYKKRDSHICDKASKFLEQYYKKYEINYKRDKGEIMKIIYNKINTINSKMYSDKFSNKYVTNLMKTKSEIEDIKEWIMKQVNMELAKDYKKLDRLMKTLLGDKKGHERKMILIELEKKLNVDSFAEQKKLCNKRLNDLNKYLLQLVNDLQPFIRKNNDTLRSSMDVLLSNLIKDNDFDKEGKYINNLFNITYGNDKRGSVKYNCKITPEGSTIIENLIDNNVKNILRSSMQNDTEICNKLNKIVNLIYLSIKTFKYLEHFMEEKNKYSECNVAKYTMEDSENDDIETKINGFVDNENKNDDNEDDNEDISNT